MFAWWGGTEFRNTQGFDRPAMRGNVNYRSNLTQVLDLTHTFTPTLFADLRVSFNRTWNTTHNLHYGGQVLLMRAIPGFVLGNPNGSFNFNSGFTQERPNISNRDGAALANLLLGYPSGGNVDFNFDVYESYPYIALYLQDDFKIRRNLTLNLGLRWDVELSPRERYNKLNAGFDYNALNPITDQITFPTLPNGASMANPIKGGFRFSSDELAPYDTQWDHWQPRLGFAWAINPKTVLRGGWGIYSAFAIELGGNTTWTQSTQFQSSLDGGNTPSGFFNTGVPYPNGVVLPVGNSLGLLSGIGNGQSFDQRDRKIPSVQQYSFGIQRELPGRFALDVSYIGSRTRDLRVGTQINHLTPEQIERGRQDPNFLEQIVPNLFFGVLPPASSLGSQRNVRVKMLMTPFPHFWNSLFSNTEPVGSSNYNSLAVKLEKRLSGGGALINGLSLLTSFTYSRTMAANGFLNNSSPNPNGTGGGLMDSEPFYAITGSDRTLDFAISGVWGLPIGKGGLIGRNARGALGHLINNWTLDWIFTANSGTPIGLPNGFAFNCPQNNHSYLPKKQTWTQWLYNETPSCFTPLGNVPFTPVTVIPRVSYVRAPYAPQLAMAVAKQFVIRENMKLQFKAEAFNLTNTPIFGGPSTGNPNQPIVPVPGIEPGSPGSFTGYGTIGSTQQNFPRQIQMSLKLIF